MAANIIRTARLTDRQVLKLVQALNTEFKLQNAQIVLDDQVHVDFRAIISSDKASDKDLLKALTSDRHAIHSAHIVISTPLITVVFNRGIMKTAAEREASAYFDEVTVTVNPRSDPNPKDFLRCIVVVEDALPEVLPARGVDEGQDVISVLRTEMAANNELYRQMTRELGDERIEILKGLEDERRKIAENRTTAEAELEREARSRQEDFDKIRTVEEEKLANRNSELDAREKELDNRDHMHVRRELREKQTANVKERLEKPIVSKPAAYMRLTIFIVSIFAALGLGYFALSSFETLAGGNYIFDEILKKTVRPSIEGWQAWTLIIRGVLSSILAGGLLVFAIVWLRHVYLDDVRAERQLERYAYDIDRASWAIETVMEMGEIEKLSVPDAWIVGVCRNLFGGGEGDGRKSASALALASLLNSSARVKIGPDGTEVEMKGRGARRVAKEISEVD